MPLYEVTYTPAAVVERAARRAGMKDGDGSSLWDWVEDANYVHGAGRYTDFNAAVKHAQSLCPLDVCGETRVEEVVRVHWRGAPPTTESVAGWCIYHDTDLTTLKAAEPQWREELSLASGDEVLCA